MSILFHHQGRDLLQMIETTGVEIMASGQYTAQTRIQVLLDDIKDVYLELEDVAEVRRVRLEQCRNLRHFEIEAEQVGGLCFHVDGMGGGFSCCQVTSMMCI